MGGSNDTKLSDIKKIFDLLKMGRRQQKKCIGIHFVALCDLFPPQNAWKSIAESKKWFSAIKNATLIDSIWWVTTTTFDSALLVSSSSILFLFRLPPLFSSPPFGSFTTALEFIGTGNGTTTCTQKTPKTLIYRKGQKLSFINFLPVSLILCRTIHRSFCFILFRL